MEIRPPQKDYTEVVIPLLHGPSSPAQTDVIWSLRQFFWRLPTVFPGFQDKKDKEESFHS